MNYPAISAFSKLILSEPEYAPLGIQSIIPRVQSSNEWEVMQMLNVSNMYSHKKLFYLMD